MPCCRWPGLSHPPPTALLFWPLLQHSRSLGISFGWVGDYFGPFLCLHTALGFTNMALNIPGVVMMVVFYVLILGTGLWGARKSRKAERSSSGDRTAVVLLGDRRIGLLVGIFTMTGMLAGGTQVELLFANWNCNDSIMTVVAVHYVKGFWQFLHVKFIFFSQTNVICRHLQLFFIFISATK